MGDPEIAETGLMRGISTVGGARMEVAGSTQVGDPGLPHCFHAPHSAHQESWLGTCVPVWGVTLPSILHPGLSAGILRGDSAGVMDRWPYLHLLPGAHLSNSGFSPQSKESCRSLTRLAWPGMRKRPSSVSPRSRMKSTHCSTSSGARRGPYFCSWWTVSSSRCPKIPGHREELVTPSAS